jgi:hypothetical protein
MQDPNEDTEWNDILRAKGIIPEKPKEKEITEDDIVSMLEQTVKEKSSGQSFFPLPNGRIWDRCYDFKIIFAEKF